MKTPTFLKLAAGVATLAIISATATTAAQAAPVASKFVFSSHLGWDVNQTTGGDICTVASRNTCQPGMESSEPGGFNEPHSVAVNQDPASADYGDVYVSDENNHRVQVLSATGVFVGMFGWEVNKTKAETPGATQAEKNVCTAESKDVCKAGVHGEAPGQIYEGFSIATDAATGNVFLAEKMIGEAGGETAVGYRVQEFTAAGTWMLEIGKDVNATTKGNVCTEQEVETGTVKCQGPALIPGGISHSSTEPGAFNLDSRQGNVLAVGGPEDLLYVGDEHRVQEFKAGNGEPKGEISLTSISSEPESDVVALAVDEAGDVYLAYGVAEHGASTGLTNVIREFNPGGTQSAEFEVAPEEANPERSSFFILTFALDSHGRLGVITHETITNNRKESKEVSRGMLYSSAGVRIGEFVPPSGSMPHVPKGLAFAASDELYVANGEAQEIEAYAPALFPESVTCPASEVEATTATLCGEINPNGLQTRGFFDYGPPVGAHTPVAFEGEGVAPESVSWHLSGLEPNQTYGYEVAAEAEVAGEQVTGNGEQVLFHTATPPPEIPGLPSVSDVSSAFVLLSASVNPEHAPARYHFEYGPCAVLAGCAGVASTPDQESSVYGQIAAIQEITGLQPQAAYSYRLVADNEHEEPGHVLQGGETVGVEGHFATGASPVPVAQTGAASAVGVTSAVIAGLVNPDGQPAVYAFELGVYNGAGTRYGVVFSGPAGSSTTAIGESLPLSGLQPGTTYAYRVVVRSGYGEAIGQTLTFTTEGLPSVLTVPAPLAQLVVPNIAFPGEAKGSTTTKKTTVKCKKGKKLDRGKCVAGKARKQAKKAKKTSRSGRARR